jgi:DNA-directed RNA polymerase specialized sigma24 family protein
MTLDPRLLSWPSLRSLRGLLAPVRRWSAGDVTLSPADRYRRETELEEAIRTLPAELRTVFELSYWHDLVHTEIAEALGVPVGTVTARIWRATETLRHLLAADDPS